MTPEATIISVNAIFLAFAYLWAYPGLSRKTINVIMAYDLAISAAAVLVAGLLFWGTGTRSSLILFSANWAMFSCLTLVVMEIPLFLWFAKRNDLRF